MMNRKNRRTLARVFLITLATMSFLVWTFSSSATRRSGANHSPDKNKTELVNSKITNPAFNLNALMIPKPASADLSQVRNGGVGCDATVPNSCDDPADWVNGNAGAQNAHYQEGQSIPYRLVMKDLPIGTHSVVIEWDVKHSSANAIDFITHFQRVNESIQPCGPSNHPEDIVAGCNPADFTTFDIPAPTGVNSPIAGLPESVFNALPVAQRRMTMYNGEISSMVYTNPQGDLSQATASTEITVNFTNTNSTVVMAWGGHIARAIDWGAGNSAGGISGSPYHTRLISLDGSGGNQDRSLSAAAVQAPQGCSLTNDNIDVCDLPAVTTHALSGTASADQTYSFNLVNNGGSAFISSSDTDPSDGTISAQVTTSGAGSYTITLTTTNAGGSVDCSATVRVHAPPAASAGTNQEQCETSGFAFTMNASSTVPTGGTRTWTIDAANSTTTASIVNPSDEDPVITLAAVGTVRAKLTVTGPSCSDAVSTVDLTVSPKATVNAGVDQTVCASSPDVTLNGSFGGSALSASWSGGTGSFNPDANTLNAIYTPSAAEITVGTVTLTLTTDDPAGSCIAVSDTMTITINANPSVEISLEDECLGTAHLHATVTGGNAPFIYTWKKNGDTVVQPNSADLALSGPGSYTVSVSDSSTPSCGSNTDTFVVCFTESISASAPAQGTPNSLNAAIKPKSESSILLARLAVLVVSTFGFAIL